jgi:hypothetical protein
MASESLTFLFRIAVISGANSTPPNQQKLKWVIDTDKSVQPQFFRSRIKAL